VPPYLGTLAAVVGGTTEVDGKALEVGVAGAIVVVGKADEVVGAAEEFAGVVLVVLPPQAESSMDKITRTPIAILISFILFISLPYLCV